MSRPPKGRLFESLGMPIPIPPIEIGSFVASRADKSEFIGSASGVFFANTVFRSFAALSPAPSGPDQPAADVLGQGGRNRGAPDSAHDYVLASRSLQEEQAAEDAALGAVLNSQTSPGLVDGAAAAAAAAVGGGGGGGGASSYGITAPGLGVPPSAAAARSLLMAYFQKWHPFFPFLHGPSFFEQVNGFYDATLTPSGHQQPTFSLRTRMLQAVQFQCVFNIAATSTTQPSQPSPLGDECRISSTAALTSLLGIISSGHDLPSLQTLLAVEIYLMTRMALRAASTVHGTLTRILYHCGLHRCPFRFVQLPHNVRHLRQRIFWCAYVLDRQLSQLLGHPPSIKDAEVDVCIPGMAELHDPVKASAPTSSSLANSSEEVAAHLPRNHAASRTSAVMAAADAGSSVGESPIDTHSAENTGIEAESPARHHRSTTKEAGEFVLSYLVTYSRLSGAAFDLFHTSIHNRYVTWDQVLELSSKVHSWWNGLPLALQEDGAAPGHASPHFSSYFAMLYQYLVLFINRSPLSLPIHRMEFRSSIQAALSASRAIVRNLRKCEDSPALLAWPTTLSSTWMAGLVIAFAALLNIYPFHKARADLNDTLMILDTMSPVWVGARHCRAAVHTFLGRLTARANGETVIIAPITVREPENEDMAGATEAVADAVSRPGSGSKRRRYTKDIDTHVAYQYTDQLNDRSAANGHYSEFAGQHPVLEYAGPDFGFDSASATAYQWDGLVSQGLDMESSAQLFNSTEWDVYMQSLGGKFGL